MEKINANPFMEVNASGKEILRGLKRSVYFFRSNRGMAQNIYSLERTSKVEDPTGINTLALVGHTILKIIASIALSILILLGVVGFFPLVMVSNNVILEVFIPLFFYHGMCGFGLYYMWTPMSGWGTN